MEETEEHFKGIVNAYDHLMSNINNNDSDADEDFVHVDRDEDWWWEAMSAVCMLGVVGRGVVKNDKEHAITILHQSRNYIKHFASQVVKTIISLLLATKYTQLCCR